MIHKKIFKKAEDLPQNWNNFNANLFLSKKYLNSLEKTNPCNQEYFTDNENYIALRYKLKLNIFTFLRNFSLKLNINIIGIAMSVQHKGYEFKDKKVFEDFIRSLDGINLILNSDDELCFSKGHTLPNYVLNNKYSNLDDYLLNMRSSYRYRLKKALKKAQALSFEFLEYNDKFDEKMYELYLEVYSNSKDKLECLSMDFFKTFDAKIFFIKIQDEKVAFAQIKEDKEDLIFMFCGFSHKYNIKYDLYINLLLKIVDYGIERGFKNIVLGQTTKDTKMKLGALKQNKYLYIYSRYIPKFITNMLAKSLSYKEESEVYNVFKN